MCLWGLEGQDSEQGLAWLMDYLGSILSQDGFLIPTRCEQEPKRVLIIKCGPIKYVFFKKADLKNKGQANSIKEDQRLIPILTIDGKNWEKLKEILYKPMLSVCISIYLPSSSSLFLLLLFLIIFKQNFILLYIKKDSELDGDCESGDNGEGNSHW